MNLKMDLETMRGRLVNLIKEDKTKEEIVAILEADYDRRPGGCPPRPPKAGCLQFQQSDATIAGLKRTLARDWPVRATKIPRFDSTPGCNRCFVAGEAA